MKLSPADRPTRNARILGLGAYRPARVVDNRELAPACGVTESWFPPRTGIRSHRMADETETLSAMGISAAQAALEAAGTTAREIGCILVTTMGHTSQLPSLSPQIAHGLGADHAVAYDVSSACSGFCYCLATARDHIGSGNTDLALVIATERVSDFVDFSDRSIVAIFGDGAGAAVVGPSDSPGIGPVTWGSKGSGSDVIRMTRTWPEYAADRTLPAPAITMDGNKVWTWVRHDVTAAIGRALDSAGVGLADLAAFIPHQANGRIIDMLAEQLELPDHVVIARDVIETGNTSAASIPLAIERLLRDGSAKKGDLALLFGFGAGLTYAGQLIELP
ncbi:beta-ketoacyl-ACP synthase 3 [Streptomyces boncukensis]|uniref:Beta-ketoacyl-ACP synthase III n=1 Tax=Streptomyces boncukensis TaxID=2711219 RepID=A0A6G4WXR3_9ACTN|nr:beta-ketoacyl-ACP synthase 3 [Streptomyces boncukensis]NGO69314.1 beta-ketoacyl-ACP synthase III [Streptomyces boncukensis]